MYDSFGEAKKMLNVGLVMPIAPIDGCSAEHWIDVKRIIHESLSALPGYTCDPKIVDTGVIEHLQYPRDLRYKDIVEFKELLAKKVMATYEDSLADPTHSPFLKSFGTFKVASLKESEVSADQFIMEALRDLQSDITEIKALRAIPATSPNLNSVIKKQSRIQQIAKKYLVELLQEHVEPGTNEMPVIDSISDLAILLEEKLTREGFHLPFSVINQLAFDFMVDNGIPFIKR